MNRTEMKMRLQTKDFFLEVFQNDDNHLIYLLIRIVLQQNMGENKDG